MKKLIISFSILLFSFFSFPQSLNEEEINNKVTELLSKMTIEEKVGQMTQITLQVVSKQQGTKDQTHILDEAKLEETIVKYNVGSILNVYDVWHSIDYWHEIITKVQDIATKKTRLGIPVIYGIDAIHGATYTQNSTLFPQAINMAATFNKELEMKAGEITALEVRASGIPWDFYPVMDLGRQPLWPRFWETFGEDVFLASEMGKNFILGAQGNDISDKTKIATCLKHFVGYSFPINGKDRTPAWISERMLREYFLPSFEAGIKAGAKTVMVNSSEVDGIPTHSDYHLLTEVLKGELNFKGFVVSDWEDIKRLFYRDKVAKSPKDAVRMAVMAGVDMSMVPLDFSFYNYLIELVKENRVPMERIDDAVSRILKVKFELGLFENPYPNKELISKFATEESRQLNLQAAQESIVLVKNDNNFLPLSKNIKALVTGPTANMLSVLNGGWTITWQGNEESLYPKEKKTFLEALQDKIGVSNVSYVQGTDFSKEINIGDAVNAAKNVDVIFLCLGEPAYCEWPGNINDLTLDDAQLNLAKTLIKTNKPIVLIMYEGRPRVINKIVDGMKAILIGMLPGMEGAVATTDIIFGDVNPSGKLPFTYPKYPNAIYHYDYKPLENFEINKFEPQWTFGDGLSYTNFSYSDLWLENNKIQENDSLKVKVKVTNIGKVKGKESVLLYLTDIYGSVSRPNKQLKGFTKIELEPGASQEVEFTITPEHLSFIGRDNKRIIEHGEYRVTINKLTKDFFLEKTME